MEQVKDQKKGQSKMNPRALFPSFWLMASAVAVTLLLNLFCGIKIMNLESERNQLRLEKVTIDERAKSLEADIASHSKLLEELPELKSRQTDLNANISGLEGKIHDLTSREAALLQTVTTLQNDLEVAVADRKQAEAATKSAREEAGRLKSEISGLKSQESTLAINVAKLRQDVTRLGSQVAELTARTQSLNTEIANMAKTKEARLSDLEALTKDNSRLVELGSHLENLAAGMEDSRKKSEEAAGALKLTADTAQQAVTELATNSQSTGNAIEDLHGSIERFARLVGEFSKDRNDTSTAVADLARAGTEAKAQAQRLTTQLDSPIKSLNSNTAVLGRHIQDFGDRMNDISRLETQVVAAEQALQEFTAMMNRLSPNVSDVEGTNQELKNAVAELKTTLAEITSALTDIGKLREEASSTLLFNGNKLKTELENMVRDAGILQKEIRVQLEVAREQLIQSQSSAAKTENTP
ncbi:uncharacterized protein Dmul_04380 [Desulfococcus multivorans]|nr:uncharacterized protein Dmul_04380 [Desulfococcus multivorans]